MVFLIVIPISPLLPFIFYWASFPSNSFSKFLKFCGLDPDEVDANDYRTASSKPTPTPILSHQQPLLQNNSISISLSSSSPSSYLHYGVGKNKTDKELKKAQRKAKYERMNAWFQTRILFNCGFLIEGVMQSFPQAILQCVAMMHYGEDDNYLAVISIILSLLSIGIKSIVMFLDSYCTIYIIHKWMSCMTDFLAIFVTISLAFSHIDDNQQQSSQCIFLCDWIEINGISWLGYFWFYKVFFITLPLVFLLVLGLILFYVHSFWEENNCLKLPLILQCCSFFPSLFIFLLLWIPGIIGVVIGCVGFEVGLYCWFLWLFHQWNHDRFPTDSNHPNTWNLLFKFLMTNDKYDKKFKKLSNINVNIDTLKMYSINYILSDTKSYYNDQRNDQRLYQFLDKKELTIFGCCEHKIKQSQTKNNNQILKLNDFWINSGKYNPKKESVLYAFILDMCSIYPELCDKICQTGRYTEVHFYIGIPAFFIFTFVCWIFGPLYFIINRFLSFIYPFMALLWLLYPKYDNTNNGSQWFQFNFNQEIQWKNLTMFQYCITSVFIIFDIICLYLTIKLISFERLLSYILPGNDYINIYSRRKSNLSIYDQVIDFYEFHKYNVLTNNYLISTYGDIAYIIISYLPQSFNQYKNVNDNNFKDKIVEIDPEVSNIWKSNINRRDTIDSIEYSLDLE